MNTAIIFIKGKQEKELALAELLGKSLIERTIKELKKASIEKIYLIGGDDLNVDNVTKAKDINKVIQEIDKNGKCILTTPFYPFVNKDDYKKLLEVNDKGAVACNNDEVFKIYMVPNNKLNEFEKIEYQAVEFDADRAIMIGDEEFEFYDEEEFEEDNFKEIKVFALPASAELGEEICSYLGITLGKIEVNHFADGETLVEIGESVRGKRVFLIQSTCAPTNERLMEVLIALNALKLGSATAIGVLMPYYGYARQDRKAKPRQPITAKLVADLLGTAGAYRVVTVDLHAAQIEGFFNFPVDNLTVIPMMANYYRSKGIDLDEFIVVSPDHGGVNRARRLAENLGVSMAIIDKRRPRPNEVEVANIIGNVEGLNCIMVDDICDTGRSLVAASETLKEHGAKDIYVCLAHGVFSGNATERIEASPIKEVVVTNSIPLSPKNKEKTTKIVMISIAKMMSEVIRAITNHTPVSRVYDLYNKK